MTDDINLQHVMSSAPAPKDDEPLVSAPQIRLAIRSVSVVEDSVNRAPSGKPMDIVELELAVPDAPWMRAMDKLRLHCERGMADKAVAALGLYHA